MKKLAAALLLLTLSGLPAGTQARATFDTWANWTQKISDSFKGLRHRKLPGRTVGLIVPADDREDIFALTAAAYNVLSRSGFKTVMILIQAPPNASLDGLAVPDGSVIDTTFGRFSIDTNLRDLLLEGDFPARADGGLFGQDPPLVVQRQLAFLKYILKGGAAKLKVLPIYVNFSDPVSQTRDYGPFLVDRIRDAGLDKDLLIVTAANLTRAGSADALIAADAVVLRGLRNLDIDALLEARPEADSAAMPDVDALSLGLLTLRWAGADHGEVLAYGDSARLILTKDKRMPLSYAAAGVVSAPPLPARIPHAPQEKMLNLFDYNLRADILTMTRQACLSAIDPTAAKPPALSGHKQASKRWPVYVTVYDDKGVLIGQAGTHEATGPLEESLRRYAVDCIRNAGRKLDRASFKTAVVDVSIPFGFHGTSSPNDLVPLLNGAIVTAKGKSIALHPDAWRKYPDVHQLLAQLSYRLDLPPWGYALDSAQVESFRIFAFNEKEPMPQMVQPERKRKGRGGESSSDDDLPPVGGESSGSGSGGSMFGF